MYLIAVGGFDFLIPRDCRCIAVYLFLACYNFIRTHVVSRADLELFLASCLRGDAFVDMLLATSYFSYPGIAELVFFFAADYYARNAAIVQELIPLMIRSCFVLACSMIVRRRYSELNFAAIGRFVVCGIGV